MTSPPSAVVRVKIPRAMLPVLILLALSAFLNFVDRGNLSIAAPLVQDELGLAPAKLGILLSSFFWTYATFQLVSGWLVDRLEAGWVVAAGFFLWSAATAATGFVHGFAVLLLFRLLLGMGESVAYPSYSSILARYYPESQRGFANSVIITGFYAGPAFGLFLGGILMGRYGWRPFFIILGLASFAWLLPWLRWMPRGQRGQANSAAVAPRTLQILRVPSAWGTFASLFFLNYLQYFFITWLPFYLVRGRHFSMDRMAVIAGGSYLSCAVTAAICGRLSDRWIGRGASPTLVRKTFTGGGMAGAAIFAIAAVLTGPGFSTAAVILTTSSLGMSSSNVWAITQTLAGPQAAGRWTGLQNFVGNFAGIVAPALTGFVLDRTGNFFWPFAITAAMCLLGAGSWIFLIGPVKQVVWESQVRVKPIPH
ncbi:MAG TPA: MFS transporter [Candidatus Dormibacteraeota bacterium]|nr:MFS transporter [Candidatus Dormibacteraeota bacterium]